MGGAVENLEREFAAWLGVPCAVAAGFGRSALALAVEAGISPGSDVLVPDFICAQVPEAVRRGGCRPVFYSVRRDLETRAEDLQAARTPDTRAAIVVHYFGRAQPRISELAGWCRESGVMLIEDCALALGARAGNRWTGSLGDLSVFSFSKSNWCYGGGLVAMQSKDILARAAAVRAQKFRAHAGLAFRYGLLRRADFAANRPRWCRTAERAGRWFQALVGMDSDENFYDAGQFDAAMTEPGARRASHILRSLPTATRRRSEILMELHKALARTGHWLARLHEPGDSGAYLLLECPPGKAADWVARADRAGVTLRRCWPAHQGVEPGQSSGEVAWLADCLLILELHDALSRREIERIGATLVSLSERQ